MRQVGEVILDYVAVHERLNLACKKPHEHSVSRGCYEGDERDIAFCELYEYAEKLERRIRSAERVLDGRAKVNDD